MLSCVFLVAVFFLDFLVIFRSFFFFFFTFGQKEACNFGYNTGVQSNGV